MIVIDVSAVIPFLLYKDEEIGNAIEQALEIVTPELFLPESYNVLLQYVKKELTTLEEAYKYINQALMLLMILSIWKTINLFSRIQLAMVAFKQSVCGIDLKPGRAVILLSIYNKYLTFTK